MRVKAWQPTAQVGKLGFLSFEAGEICGDIGTQNNPQDKQTCCFGLVEWSLIFCGLQAQLIGHTARRPSGQAARKVHLHLSA